MPHPADDRLGKARQERWATLSDLQAVPDAAVREIARALADVQHPPQRMEPAEALSFFPTKESAAKLCELLDDSDPAPAGDSFAVERLLASLERITGKSFGGLPCLNPILDSDSRRVQESARRYQELLDTWAAWWAWEPADRRNAKQP